VHIEPELHQKLARKYTMAQWRQSEVYAARDAPEGTVRRSSRRMAAIVTAKVLSRESYGVI
jgi:hypothetical protein